MDLDQNFLNLVNLIKNNNYDEFITLLNRYLSEGFPIDYQYRAGHTLLTYTIYSVRIDNYFTKFIKKIIQSGADVNKTNENRRIFDPWLSLNIPPLVWACLSRSIVTIDLLLEYGANLHFKINTL
jgi:ankyrin repeat protein